MSEQLSAIFERLQSSDPPLLNILSLTQLVRFIVYTAALKQDILLTQSARNHDPLAPPSFLSGGIQIFLSKALKIPCEVIQKCWDLFKDLVWSTGTAEELMSDPVKEFRASGYSYGLTYHSFYPPNQYCVNSQCTNQTALKRAKQREVVFFTFAQGPVPANAISLYCDTCHTSYQHNYYVQGDQRVYWDGVPDAIEAGEHQFVERRVIEGWLLDMLYSWKSATNCARTYNSLFLGDEGNVDEPCSSTPGSDHPGFRFSPLLRPNHVWDSIILLCLLEDYGNRNTALELNNTADQDTRLRAAMQARNIRLQRYGLGETLHRCNKCVRFFDNREMGDGISCTRVVVIDGITIGHPCCSVYNCKEPLKKQTNRFCERHKDQNNMCCLTECNARVIEGHMVCADEAHLDIEKVHRLRGQARVRHVDAENLGESMNLDGEEVYDINSDNRVVGEDAGPAMHPHNPISGNKRLRAQFGRRRTHGEQLGVGPCGTIFGRGTMVGAKGIYSTSLFLHALYKFIPPPEHIFYDNNCHFARMVRNPANPDHFFDNERR
ncbi:hypothetical protein BDY19DRAFT_1023122 [Irpex rosettiformis]|uniref:Uncharacterized protein n=1 Tax=Irpex rosettiformis TaxID=378272 RepID=A0ACB8TSD9_9APHY|nr:hypothetical protein BDY19DRAFT_1023122 [Irpex rosettiformis]